jgi:hypothetical protein
MILNYREKAVGEGDITEKLTRKLTGLRGHGGGTSFYQMQRIAVELYDLPSFVIHNCDLESLKAAIVNGWPPIISYRSGEKSYHAVVAVGYNDKRRIILIHDPNYLRVREIRYFDLGGVSRDSVQRISCLLVLPRGSTEEDLKRGLERYVPKELISGLRVSPMLPSQN